MKTNITLLALLCCISFGSFKAAAQVGINTTTPGATLDISGKPTVTTELDGVIPPRIKGDQLKAKTYTAAQTAAIVYVTDATTTPAGQTINVTVPGYFYFNGTAWIALTPAGDADFFKVGTFVPPTLITEDVWRTGKVAIGKATPSYALDVENATDDRAVNIVTNGATAGLVRSLNLENANTNTGTDSSYGIYNKINVNRTKGSTDLGRTFGIWNDLTSATGTGRHTGILNRLTGINDRELRGAGAFIDGAGNGNHYGIYSEVKSTGTGKHYGTYNQVNDGTGTQYGTFNNVSNVVTGQIGYGTYNDVNGGLGTLIAGYFDAYGTLGTYYAAIFNRGNVGIGTNTPAAKLDVLGTTAFNGGNTTINASKGNYDLQVSGQSDTNLLFVDASGNNVGIGTTGVPTTDNKLEVNGRVQATDFKLAALNTAPPTSNTAGVIGEIRIGTQSSVQYIYICYATNLWRRIPFPTATW